MKTEIYELKEATLTIEEPELTDIRKAVENLPDEHLLALAMYGLAQWSYRGAAKAANDGKHFTFAAACAEMAKTGTRSSGPSKADEKAAEAWFKTVASMAAKAPEAERSGYPIRILSARISANNEKWDGLNFSYDGADAQKGYALLCQAVRLHAARQTKMV